MSKIYNMDCITMSTDPSTITSAVIIENKWIQHESTISYAKSFRKDSSEGVLKTSYGKPLG